MRRTVLPLSWKLLGASMEIMVRDNMDQEILQTVYRVGQFFVGDIYACYQDTYKGIMGKVQIEVLDYLHSKQYASASELAEKLNISKQHASKIAVNLASRGYAEKIPDPSDGRGTLYSLTKAGETFIQEHISLSNAHFLQFLDSLDERNRVKLINALNDLDEVFNDSKNV